MSGNLYLFATIAQTPVAIPAHEVEAVVRLGELVPVPGAADHVRGLAALRSRVLTVIDMRARVFGEAMALGDKPLAVVADIAGHAYGLLVDAVSDICPSASGVQPMLGRTDKQWTAFADNVVEREGVSHLVLSVDDFVAAGTA